MGLDFVFKSSRSHFFLPATSLGAWIMSHQVSMWRLFFDDRTLETAGHSILQQLQSGNLRWSNIDCISLPPLARSKQMNMPWLKCSTPSPRKNIWVNWAGPLVSFDEFLAWDTINRLIGVTTYRNFCSRGNQPEFFWPTGPLHRLLQWLWAAQRFSNLP